MLNKFLSLVLFGALAGVSSVALADESAPLQPNDFASGANLTTSQNTPFYQIKLLPSVYTGTVYSDLRDIRVFNGNGQVVPYTLVRSTPPAAEPRKAALQVFVLSQGEKSNKVTRETERQEEANGSGQIVLRSDKRGVVLHVSPVDSAPVQAAYLLEFRPVDGEMNASRIELNWQGSDAGHNWRVRASLQGSNDMNSWTDVVEEAPLMDLVSGTQRLRVNDLKFNNDNRQTAWRYWLLTLQEDEQFVGANKGFVPTIDSAQISYAEKSLPPQTVSLAMMAKKISSHEIEYALPNSQSLSSVKIVLPDNNVVMPVEVDYRSTVQDAWHSLGKMVLYRFDGNRGAGAANELSVEGQTVQALRLRTTDSNWGEELPTVEGMHDEMTFVFNARGNGPFILAWGSRVATNQALPLNTLTPLAALQKLAVDNDISEAEFVQGSASQRALDVIPWAFLEKPVTLGGESRLTDMAPAEKASLWQKGLLWVLLIVGALGLVWMAMRLWREMAK